MRGRYHRQGRINLRARWAPRLGGAPHLDDPPLKKKKKRKKKGEKKRGKKREKKERKKERKRERKKSEKEIEEGKKETKRKRYWGCGGLLVRTSDLGSE